MSYEENEISSLSSKLTQEAEILKSFDEKNSQDSFNNSLCQLDNLIDEYSVEFDSNVESFDKCNSKDTEDSASVNLEENLYESSMKGIGEDLSDSIENEKTSEVSKYIEEDTDELLSSFGQNSLKKGEECDVSDFSSAEKKEKESSSFLEKNEEEEKNIFHSTRICSGFKTGNNKTIKINEEVLNNAKKKLESEVHTENKIEEKESEKILPSKELLDPKDISTLKEEKEVKHMDQNGFLKDNSLSNSKRIKIPLISNKPMRTYLKPEIGHISNDLRRTEKMFQIYENVKKVFPNQEEEWIHIQFKWSWMSNFVTKTLENEDLQERIIEQMRLRKKNEYSILRRIVEKDDVPWKYMVLLVINITPSYIEVYDGYYSLKCSVDKEIHKRIISQNLKIGNKIKLFGAESLLSEAVSIYEVKDCALKLYSNGLRVIKSRRNNYKIKSAQIENTKKKRKLGYQNKISFVTEISNISKAGGPISCIEIEVLRIVESKILIKVGNYKNFITEDEIDEEMEKLRGMTAASNTKLEDFDVMARKYIKMVVKDLYSNTECLLTWWMPSIEVTEKMNLRFIYLKVVESSAGLHLSTIQKTYVKKI